MLAFVEAKKSHDQPHAVESLETYRFLPAKNEQIKNEQNNIISGICWYVPTNENQFIKLSMSGAFALQNCSFAKG